MNFKESVYTRDLSNVWYTMIADRCLKWVIYTWLFVESLIYNAMREFKIYVYIWDSSNVWYTRIGFLKWKIYIMRFCQMLIYNAMLKWLVTFEWFTSDSCQMFVLQW